MSSRGSELDLIGSLGTVVLRKRSDGFTHTYRGSLHHDRLNPFEGCVFQSFELVENAFRPVSGARARGIVAGRAKKV